ncbi:hypothetical protein GF345_00240 [Candidatus Woesearchaeota archaeon]|nr:hypothetical protein [Candidatus Woesearchaeota archaeon]
MEFLIYFLTAVLAYIGLAGGFALAQISPEEMKPGRKYFDALNYILFSLIMLMLLFFESPTIGITVLLAISIYIKFGRQKATLKIAYGVLGAVLALLTFDKYIFMITASLIFMFGIVSGTLCSIRHSQMSRKQQFLYIMGSNALFFLTALPLYFLELKVIP